MSDKKPLTKNEIIQAVCQKKDVWGLLDTKDNVWIGSSTEPFVYWLEDIAVLAARMASPMLKYAPGRV